jgi:hypothetical protein
VPLKIKFFLWQLHNNKLQVAANLAKKGWKGDKDCCLYTCVETEDHIFFKCHLAKIIWKMFKEIFWLDSYRSLGGIFVTPSSWARGHVRRD